VTLLTAALALAVLAAGWVVHPLVMRRWSPLTDVVAGHLVDREARRRVALSALKEVEYDHASGKLDARDYADLKTRLQREALLTLRAGERTASAAEPRSAPDETSGGDEPSTHLCGFSNPVGSRFCTGCGKPLP
jgi:hypothetical protein